MIYEKEGGEISLKSFISKNWEKILIFIACVFLVLIFVGKVTAEKTLIEDYAKYGKTFVSASTNSSSATNSSDKIANVLSGEKISGDIANSQFMQTLTEADPELFKVAMILIAGILGVVILTSLPGMFDKKKDAKKKK